MNKRQKLTKKLAKRAKARENKKELPNAGPAKQGYISKAERAKIAAAEAEQAKNCTAEQPDDGAAANTTAATPQSDSL
ncbi:MULTISPECIES: DUF2986 domain-containing protein [Shewanella]|jgi:hypothetical protein|uniref:DUF2986 domain-containing protein n=1 Tax=Shewanella TaxID=22 RepID=UPI000579DFB0|nr:MULTISPECIES: DUF2986 domain-containing protein [Shewanella]BCV36486.1 hypothetical protein TUM17377_18140 [Shewanella chilikensis]MCE9793386.1 DUF2986 domain-containing protein [Shewanella indica]NDO73101.1 DUF2986 domain-containing protein [Shewanella sp. SE1]OHY52144.1 hypothetical protein BEH76_17785 [Shewanella algae]TVP08659.1 hypothetical protein AYI96_19075 [Shewanella sp. MSW]